MLKSELTKGMSMIEIITVLLASRASKRELRRLLAFFQEITK